jgi:heme/copper-type cytochrome/quinol oxidase subunit 3
MIPPIALGISTIALGIFIIIFQIRRFKNGLKDPFGFAKSSIILGFFLIVIGIIVIVKYA